MISNFLSKRNHITFNGLMLTASFIIIFGITLLFSTATRSVFEVNKLGITKLGICIFSILYAYDLLFNAHKNFTRFNQQKFFNFGILIVWISNLLSTIFSQNIRISIYGSYDRWEGLITVSFYLFMVFIITNYNNKKFPIQIIWFIVIASGLSSLYGIVQSYGLDVIKWSLNPANRVFGSINNPVHYCAIMGMSVPLIIGKIFHHLESKSEKVDKRPLLLIMGFYTFIAIISNIIDVPKSSYKWVLTYVLIFGLPYLYYGYNYIKQNSNQNKFNILFNTLILVICATFISYSRATWLGLTASLGIFFTISILIKKEIEYKMFLLIILNSILLTMLAYITIIFKIHTISSMALLSMSSLISGIVIINSIILHKKSSELIYNIGTQALIFGIYFFENKIITIAGLLSAVVITLVGKRQQVNFISSQVALIVLIFTMIRFSGSSAIEFIINITLIALLIICDKSSSRKHLLSKNTIFKWKISLIVIFGLTFLSPNIYSYIVPDSNSILTKKTTHKLSKYKDIAIKGTARTSMWKSSFPWIADYPIFGSGLDTIKYMYPKYRRPEYGKLEGGHNFTPDRLHNEFLNTLASKGIFGFITQYIILIGGALVILLNSIYKNKKNPIQFLILGCFSGALVYLGQVLFNFGVVATLVLFFILIGLSLSFKKINEVSI